MDELQSKLQRAQAVEHIVDYQSRVCEIAAICRSTFDVDQRHVNRLLDGPEDFTVFIKCSILLYDNQPPDLSNASTSLQTLFCRDRCLAHGMVDKILRMIRLNDGLLSAPISDIWPHYRAGVSGWRELPVPDTIWVSTNTTEASGRAPQSVHLNLLDGQLLVDGKPLGHLPREYVQHPTYIRLFGEVRLLLYNSQSPVTEVPSTTEGFGCGSLKFPGNGICHPEHR